MKLTKVLEMLFDKVTKPIEIRFGEHIFQYLIHWCSNTDVNDKFFESVVTTIINLLVCFSETHSFKYLFHEEFIENLKEKINEGNFSIKKCSLLLLIRLASEFDHSIIDDEIMNVIVSFLDPTSPNYEVCHLILSDLYTIFSNEKNHSNENKIFQMFLECGGDDALEELTMDETNEKVQSTAEQIIEEFLEEGPEVILDMNYDGPLPDIHFSDSED